MIGQELFNLVLPTEGLFSLVGVMRDKSLPPEVKYFALGDEAIHTTIQQFESDGRDIWFGTGTYIDATKPKSANNIHSLKSFYIDLDCEDGVDRKYASKKEAVAAIYEFCTKSGLPIPALVDSGFGVHCYWPITESIDYNTWKPIAEAFKQKLKLEGVKQDTAVTADGARSMRVPGTINTKNPKDLRRASIKTLCEPISLELFQSCINYVERGAYSVTAADPVMDALLKNSNAYKFSRIYRKSIETVDVSEQVEEEHVGHDGVKSIRLVKRKVQRSAGCPQIAYCVANRETLSEMMWRSALSIAQFCVDREDGIEAVSRGYADTTPADWSAKAARIPAPHTCQQWKSLDQPQLCGTCIHRGKINTPLVLGVVIEAATPEDNIVTDTHSVLGEEVTIEIPNEYPFPWLRPKMGGVARKMVSEESSNNDEEEDPDELMVYEHDLWVKQRMRDGEQELILLALRLPHDGLIEFTAPLAAILKAEKCQEILSSQGVALVGKRMDLIRQYIAAWVHKLQKEGSAERARLQFGWQDNNTCFVIGTREIDSTGTLRYSPITKSVESVAEIYNKMGVLSEWQKVANSYANKGCEARAFGLFASFGAPLYKFIGEGSMIIHFTNVASGVGKSTTQRVATSVWGNPAGGLLTENDTLNAKLHRAGVLNNIPVCIDEITNMTPEQASKFAFDLSSGRGKNRMKTHDNAERKNDTKWATIFQTSGNNSLYDTLKQYKSSVEGEMYRILEVAVPLDTNLTKAQADELFTMKLPNNYGMAGEEYLKYVLPNKAYVIDRLHDVRRQFDIAANLSSKDRFYSACFASAFVGAEIANKLGIISVPLEPVWDWAVALMKQTHQTIKGASLATDGEGYERVISQYWNEIMPQVLVVNAGMSEADNAILKQQALKPLIGALKGRHAVRDRRLYLSVQDFENWMSAKRLPATQIVTRLKDAGTLIQDRYMNLGEDTALYTSAPVRAYVFDVDKLQGKA